MEYCTHAGTMGVEDCVHCNPRKGSALKLTIHDLDWAEREIPKLRTQLADLERQLAEAQASLETARQLIEDAIDWIPHSKSCPRVVNGVTPCDCVRSDFLYRLAQIAKPDALEERDRTVAGDCPIGGNCKLNCQQCECKRREFGLEER